MDFSGYEVCVVPTGLDPSPEAMKQLNAEALKLGASFHADPDGVPTPWLADGHYELSLTASENLKAVEQMMADRGFRVICSLPFGVKFAGDWGELLPFIEVAAENNYTFQVDLTPDEFARLKQSDMVALKERLTKNAAGRLALLQSYFQEGGGEGPVLLVGRYGRCP